MYEQNLITKAILALIEAFEMPVSSKVIRSLRGQVTKSRLRAHKWRNDTLEVVRDFCDEVAAKSLVRITMSKKQAQFKTMSGTLRLRRGKGMQVVSQQRKGVGLRQKKLKVSAHMGLSMAADNLSIGASALALAYRTSPQCVSRELKCAASFAHEADMRVCKYVVEWLERTEPALDMAMVACSFDETSHRTRVCTAGSQRPDGKKQVGLNMCCAQHRR